MTTAPFTLHIHLASGRSIDLPCESFEIVPPSVDDEGHLIPTRIDYTPIPGWQRSLGFLDFRSVIAIEVERSEASIAADQETAGE